MKIKMCTKCNIEKPISEFSKHKGTKDGYEYHCKQCIKEEIKQRIVNRKYIEIESKRCIRCGLEKPINEFTINKITLDGYDCYCKECKRLKENEYYINNFKDRNQKVWKYHKGKQHTKEAHQRFINNHPEKVKNWRTVGDGRRRSQKYGLEYSLTIEEWQETIEYFDYCCAYCGKQLEHKDIEQEHFIPVSKSGAYTKNNILPACTHCNDSKHAKNFEDWYPKQKFYSKEREEKILKYLGYL